MNPIVSVKTITYNHAPFIQRCIEGVLMQKTNFPFELVIGEDCSTDGTREIVMDYARKYPKIIRVITSETNVGSTENSNRTELACLGEYRALCEGDDYWIDPLKLQKQYDACLDHEAVLVAHSSFVVYFENGKLVYRPKLRRAKEENGYLGLDEIISHQTPFHTSSIFIKGEILRNLPDWFSEMPLGDYPLKVIAANNGKVYYLDEVMSVYQKGVPGSFTSQTTASESQEMEREYGELRMYARLDEYTGHKYTSVIKQYLAHRKMEYYAMHGNLDYLTASKSKKRLLKGIASVVNMVPSRWRKKVLGKIAEFA